ncbi:MAG: hypothetical protein OEW05_00815, partial [Candidatus Aminicenantes bacterium]|nr:hypothetical protein [Candidatus Aminicenantes bacterium]
SAVEQVIIEYSRSPDLVAHLRRRFPGLPVHVRAVNAEALQHLHRTAWTDWRPALSPIRAIYRIVRLLRDDVRCRRLSSGVLSISAWDSRHYWARLPGRAPVYDVPYVCPWPGLRPRSRPQPWTERRDAMICLAAARDSIGAGCVRGFCSLAVRLAAAEVLPHWRFQVSAGTYSRSQPDRLPEGVEPLSGLREPWDLLCGTRAAAVLTPLGYGAKTTVFDALAARCHVLVHPRLARRLPPEVRACCVEVDPQRPPDLPSLAAILHSEPRPNAVNESLRRMALANLQAALGREKTPGR